jgi:thioredoxin-like negative regulator of GroEL
MQQSAQKPPQEMPFVYSQTLRKGMDYFHNKHYEYASQMFSVILENLPNDVNSQFYKGLSEMELHNYVPASDLLNKAILNADKTFYDEAKYKLALCYIALDKQRDAEKLLQEITQEKGFYSKQASEELQRLK